MDFLYAYMMYTMLAKVIKYLTEHITADVYWAM